MTTRGGPAAISLLVFWTTVVVGVSGASAQTPLTLDEAIRRAQAETAEARAMASAIEEADARVTQAQSGYWPRIDLTESVQRGNNPVFAFSSLLSQRRFSAANFAIPSLNHPDPLTNTRTAIGIEQPLFNAGLTMLGTRAARLGRDRARVARETGEQDLAFRAAQAFVRVLQLEAAIRAADGAVAAAESDRERARARREVGLVTEADVLAVDVHLADVRQRQIAARGDAAVARIQLAEAIGLPLTESVVVSRPVPRPPSVDEEALVREALESHPLRREADLQVELADNARRTARAAMLPTVGLQGSWEFNGPTLGTQESNWVIGAEARINLFRGFADRARITETTHARTRVEAEREQVLRRIEVDARSALVTLAAARSREEAGKVALAQARESQRIIRDRYENGLATMTDVLRAAEATLDAESRATSAEMDVILQTVALDRALGRLSVSRRGRTERP